jgi:hypothetical protein
MKPQDAPWPVGTRLKERRPSGSMGGFPDPTDSSKTIWTRFDGAMHTVVRIGHYKDEYDFFVDETGETIHQVHHDCSILQSDLDPDGTHQYAIDVDKKHLFEVVPSEFTKKTPGPNQTPGANALLKD